MNKLIWTIRWRWQAVVACLTATKTPGNHRMIKVKHPEGRNGYRYKCLCGQYTTDDLQKCTIDWGNKK